MAGKLTDLLNAGLTARLPLSGAELFEISQDVGLATLQTRVIRVSDLANAIAAVIEEPIETSDPRAGMLLLEDFLTPIAATPSGPAGLYSEVSGVNAAITSINHSDALNPGFEHVGVARLTTGNSVAAYAAIRGPRLNPPAVAGHYVSLYSRLRPFLFLPSTPQHAMELGFSFFEGGPSLVNTTDGVVFSAETTAGNPGNWIAQWRSGGAAWTTVDTGVEADYNGAEGFHEFRIDLGVDFVRFWIDGAIVAEGDSNVPIPSVPLFTFPLMLRKIAASATEHVAHVDYAAIGGNFPGGRRYS